MTTSIAWLLASWTSRPHHSIGRRHRPHHTDPAPPPSPPDPPSRYFGDQGEGVISVAIAVLIMAFLGAAMWVGFQTMWTKTSQKTDEQVGHIGGP